MRRTIEWRHDGSRLVIPVTVYPPLTGTTLAGIEGKALIDTGSTTTGLTGRLADSLRATCLKFESAPRLS